MWRAEARAKQSTRGRKVGFRGGRRYHQAESASEGQLTTTASTPEERKFANREKKGACFSCGAFGHWRNECRGNSSQQSQYQLSTNSLVDKKYNGAGVPGAEFDASVFKLVCDSTPGCVTATGGGEGEEYVDVGLGSDKLGLISDDALQRGHDQVLGVYSDQLSHNFNPDGDDLEDVDNIIFRGRLAKSVDFWQTFTKDHVVLDIIVNGYKLPLKDTSQSRIFDNNKSAIKDSEFVEGAIGNLLKVMSIEELDYPASLSSPLTVSINKLGKKRLILDLRYLNLHLFQRHFKCEDLTIAKQLIYEGDFLFKFALKNGYHHVEIFSPHKQFLGFSWKYSDGTVRYFQFAVLAFGLSTAPYIFTKLLRPLVTKWRGEGKKSLIFLDDGLTAACGFEEAKIYSLQIKSDLICSGFVSHPDKSEWIPKQVITWLGCIIDTVQYKFIVPQLRALRLLSAIKELQEFACIVGQLISMQLAVGNVVRLMTRNLYHTIESRFSWFSKVQLDDNAVNELTFWVRSIDKLNGKRVRSERPDFYQIVYSDASGQAYGGKLLCKDTQVKIVKGNFNALEQGKSSTWRELKAVLEILDGLSSLQDCHLRWYTDNQNVTRIVRIGSTVSELQELALSIFRACTSRNIGLHMEWIPRSQNVEADELSKQVDYDDWYVSDWVFRWLESLWGPHTVDRFSTAYNARLVRFNSESWVKGTEAVDALAQKWHNEINWLVPPPRRVAECVHKLCTERACGTLVVPLWRSANFWPLLCNDGVHFNWFVVDWRICPLFQTH